MKTIIKISSTFFYSGYLPLIPGTFGSLAGVLVYYLVKDYPAVYFVATLFVIVLGFLTAGRAEVIFGKKDARCIVIDEVAGILISFLFIPYDFKIIVTGFFIFRLLDAVKPYPADNLQRLKGSAGVMLDDIVAAFYTNIVLQVVLRLASIKAS